MGAAMPWFKVHAGWSSHPKVGRLCDLLGHEFADAFVARLWDYCAERQGDGRFSNPGAVGAVERATRWNGVRGALVEAMVSVGLLDREADGTLVVHDWAREQKSVAEKFGRDRERRRVEREEGRREVARPARDSLSTLNSPVSTSPASRDGGPGEGRHEVAQRPPTNTEAPSAGATPTHGTPVASDAEAFAPPVASKGPSLWEQMCDAYREARAGKKYPSNPTGGPIRTDAPAFALVLSHARDDGGDAEVLRRWRIALAWRGYPACSSIRELAANWTTYAVEQSQTPSGGVSEAQADRLRRAPTASKWNTKKPDGPVGLVDEI